MTLEEYTKLRNKGKTPEEIASTGKKSSNLLSKTAGVLSKIFPGEKIGEAIGTQAAKLMVKPEERKYVSPGPTVKQVLGDIAMVGLTIAPMTKLIKPAATIGGRLLQATKIGAGIGAASAAKQQESIIKGAASGAAVGGVTAGAFELVGAALRSVANTRMAKQFIANQFTKTLQPPSKELAQQIEQNWWNEVTKGLKNDLQQEGYKIAKAGYRGNYNDMGKKAVQDITTYGGKLKNELATKYPNVRVSRSDVESGVADKIQEVFGKLELKDLKMIQFEAKRLPEKMTLAGLAENQTMLDKLIDPTFWVEKSERKAMVNFARYYLRENAKKIIEQKATDTAVTELKKKVSLAISVKDLVKMVEQAREKAGTTMEVGKFSIIMRIINETILRPSVRTGMAQKVMNLGAKTGQTQLRQATRALMTGVTQSE